MGKRKRILDNRDCTNKIKQCAGIWDAQGTEASLGWLKHEDCGKRVAKILES